MTTRDVLVSLIDDPRIVLQEIDRESVEFLELRQSILDHGVQHSITVRETEGGRYEVINGFNRLTICRELGIAEIPVTVRNVSDEVALEMQLQSNVCHQKLSRVSIAKQLLRIQHAYPDITLYELARKAGKCPRWCKEQLSLLDLSDDLQRQIELGEIPVMNAYGLARLPARIRSKYIDKAQLMNQAEFKTEIATIIKENMIAKGTNKWAPREHEFSAHPYYRPLKDLKEKAQAHLKEIRSHGVTGSQYEAGFMNAIAWVTQTDPDSITKRETEFNARVKS